MDYHAVDVTDAAAMERVLSPYKGRITGIGKTIRITAIHVHYNLAVPAEAREATERALEVHPEGCPAHQSVKDAIAITWSATLKAGEQVVTVHESKP